MTTKYYKKEKCNCKATELCPNSFVNVSDIRFHRGADVTELIEKLVFMKYLIRDYKFNECIKDLIEVVEDNE